MKCPKCRFDNSPDFVYCIHCGSSLPSIKEILDSPTKTLVRPIKGLTRGDTFAGRYEIIEELGRGDMGDVFRVEDKKVKEEVVLKIIKHEKAADEKTIERFKSDLKFARKITHKNVCRIYDLGEDQETLYLTMEYVPGEKLKSFIKRSGKLTVGKTVDIGMQVCEGLIEAHKLAVVHSNLKSNSIVIDNEGNALIMDFGIAHSLKREGKTGESVSVGTPEYMAPEQANGQEAEHRSDLYSLGIILYEMVTGKLPFQGETALSISIKHKTEIPEDPRQQDTQIPEDLNRLILKCLEKDKRKRYQNAEELLSALGKIEKATPASEMKIPGKAPLSLRGIMSQLKKQWKMIAALGSVVIIAGIAILYLKKETPVLTSPERKMLVVLPFENLGPLEDEYFADGLTEELTSRLAALHGLGVISRTSARQYKSTNKTVKQIGEELGVDYLLEGTVRWDRSQENEGRVRVIPQLIRVADDTHLWSDSYDRVIDDIFSVQSEIAEQVIRELDITVLEPERQALRVRPTDNLEAYDNYLRAYEHYHLAYMNQDGEEYDKAIERLGRALELDPAFTYAYLLLAELHKQVYSVGIDRTDARLEQLGTAVNTALELDPDLPEAQLALGGYYVRAFQDFDRALEIYEAVKRARPNIPPFSLAFIQRRQGQWEQAIANYEMGFQLNPRDANVAHVLGRMYAWVGRYEKSEEWFDRALSIFPGLYYSKLGKARLPILSSGDTERSRVLLETLPPHILTDYNWFLLCMLERKYQEVLDRLSSTPYDSFNEAHFYIPINLAYASVYHAMNDLSLMRIQAESARAEMQKALNERPEDTRLYAALGLAYAYLDRKNDAVREGLRAVNLYPVSKDAFEGPQYVINLAKIYALVGEFEDAIDQLEHVLSIPSGNNFSVHFLRLDPIWDPLRKNPRFLRLLEEN